MTEKKDARDWTYATAKNDALKNYQDEKIVPVSYRPFDVRWTCYTGNSRGLYASPQPKVMQHFLAGENWGLNFQRGSGSKEFLTTPQIIKNIFDQGFCYPANSALTSGAPLYLYNGQIRTPNLNSAIIEKISAKLGLEFVAEDEGAEEKFSPLNLLDYIYAALHSPNYREKYKEFLKIDFPRVPYPSNQNSFWQLVKLGGSLRKIHLLESEISEKLITTYPADGDNKVEKISYESGKVRINQSQYFEGVALNVWEFFIGGYQPAQKWLKDRKGKILGFEEILHYQKIIVALSETDRLMREIDLVFKF